MGRDGALGDPHAHQGHEVGSFSPEPRTVQVTGRETCQQRYLSPSGGETRKARQRPAGGGRCSTPALTLLNSTLYLSPHSREQGDPSHLIPLTPPPALLSTSGHCLSYPQRSPCQRLVVAHSTSLTLVRGNRLSQPRRLPPKHPRSGFQQSRVASSSQGSPGHEVDTCTQGFERWLLWSM